VKTFITVIRHLLRLRGVEEPRGFAAVLTAGEAVIGPLPGHAARARTAGRTTRAPPRPR
jgi:hypothetical protein